MTANEYYKQVIDQMNRIYLNGHMHEISTNERAFQFEQGKLVTGEELSDKVFKDIRQEHIEQLSSERMQRIVTAMAVAAIEFDAKEAEEALQKERLWEEFTAKNPAWEEFKEENRKDKP